MNLKISIVFVLAAMTLSTTALADAGKEDAEKLGVETTTMKGLTGPVGSEGESDVDMRTMPIGEILPSLDGYVFRSRFLTLAPGAYLPLHSQENRPAMSYVVFGDITEYRSGQPEPTELKADENTVDYNITQWWNNADEEPMLFFTGDICEIGQGAGCDPEAKSAASEHPLQKIESEYPQELGSKRIGGYEGPAKDKGLSIENRGEIPLDKAFQDKEGLENYVIRARKITVAPNGVIKLFQNEARPYHFGIVKGELTYHSPDGSVVLHPNDSFLAKGDVMHWWQNRGDETVEIITFDLVEKQNQET